MSVSLTVHAVMPATSYIGHQGPPVLFDHCQSASTPAVALRWLVANSASPVRMRQICRAIRSGCSQLPMEAPAGTVTGAPVSASTYRVAVRSPLTESYTYSAMTGCSTRPVASSMRHSGCSTRPVASSMRHS
ncbi:hypothetical protein AB4Z54_25030, partial [Streptomyces sp. MCAF7]